MFPGARSWNFLFLFSHEVVAKYPILFEIFTTIQGDFRRKGPDNVNRCEHSLIALIPLLSIDIFFRKNFFVVAL